MEKIGLTTTTLFVLSQTDLADDERIQFSEVGPTL